MGRQEMGADECRVCYGFDNAGFDICEDCAKEEERKRILKLIEKLERDIDNIKSNTGGFWDAKCNKTWIDFKENITGGSE